MGASSFLHSIGLTIIKKSILIQWIQKMLIYIHPKEQISISLFQKSSKNKWWRRTVDLIDNYQPDILWFDFMLILPTLRN